MISEETLRLKFRNKIYIPLTAKSRRKKLKIEDFTIISNNCWGGTIYESYGIKKMSPTVGMFIMPEDYLKFCEKFDYYISQSLVFINPDSSKWKTQLCQKSNWNTYRIGRLADIELHMLHYHDENIALKKWNSRIMRINKKRILYKFNDQNGATPDHIRRFIELPLKNRLCFVASKNYRVNDEVILIKQPSRYVNGIMASREPFGKTKYIDMTEYINRLGG